MPYESFGPQDLDYINRVLRHYPEVAENIRILKMVSETTTYPIQTFDELLEAFGGDNATVTLQGQVLRLAELRAAIPAYYFPIGSEDDLIAKIADVRARGRPSMPAPRDEGNIQWGQQVDALPPGVAPPDEAVRNLPRHPGVPGSVGLKKTE